MFSKFTDSANFSGLIYGKIPLVIFTNFSFHFRQRAMVKYISELTEYTSSQPREPSLRYIFKKSLQKMLPETESSRKAPERKKSLPPKNQSRSPPDLRLLASAKVFMSILQSLFMTHLYFDLLIKNMTYDQQKFDVVR